MSDREIRTRVRNYLSIPSDENAHALARAVARVTIPAPIDWRELLGERVGHGDSHLLLLRHAGSLTFFRAFL